MSNAGMKISKDGYSIHEDGGISYTTKNGPMKIHSVVSSTISVVAGQTGPNLSPLVYHNLGYVPATISWFEGGISGGLSPVGTNWADYDQGLSGVIVTPTTIQYKVEDQLGYQVSTTFTFKTLIFAEDITK